VAFGGGEVPVVIHFEGEGVLESAVDLGYDVIGDIGHALPGGPGPSDAGVGVNVTTLTF
jgi:hypothetical protein